MAEHSHGHNHSHSGHSIYEELLCHFPYAVLGVALSLICLSMFGYGSPDVAKKADLHSLFHTLHFLHILFAATGTVLAYRKFSQSWIGTLLVGSLVPAVFCTLSDAVIPYFGGQLFGIHMHFHWCFVSHISTVSVFLLFGILNGIVTSLHQSNAQIFHTGTAHFFHIFISAFASTVYLASHGFHNWASHLGYVFAYMIVAVLIPCTLADVVVPTWFATRK